jgi:hypothetical protein
MRTLLSAVAVGTLIAALLAGCSSDPRDDPAAAAQKEKRLGNASHPPANTREVVLPWVRKANEKVVWPPAYALTPDAIYTRFMEPAKDTQFVERDAVDLVTIWNICAWTLQLINDSRTAKPVDGDVASLVKLSNNDYKPMVDPIVSEAKLGGITTASQFANANDCAKGFTG